MKNFKMLVLLVTAAATIQCDAIDELTKFDIDYTSSVTIESSSIVDLPFAVETPQLQTNSESEFESNNTNKDLIEDIRLKRMTLSITNPADKNFSFLESIEIFISADGVDEISLAILDPVPGNSTRTLDLETTGADLQEYIKKDSFKLRVQSITDEVIDQDVQIDILSVFAVDAKILGI
ncbi:hypothetical protein [Leeuwenhoekiella sp. NPDC079379]|uniref:hypothetical protein n=1 Tax=Leeuwenhoekiella sp. NPDC079379 TaxID=3364122 RepID=UPI0037CBF9A5